LWNGLPGQEGGQGVTDVIFGDVNPSGRLPFTFGKSISDYSAAVTYNGGGIVQIPYSEGLNIDYFGFDAVSLTWLLLLPPQFEAYV
jgi:beta-glucosidase